jgi:hypothetical protein
VRGSAAAGVARRAACARVRATVSVTTACIQAHRCQARLDRAVEPNVPATL